MPKNEKNGKVYNLSVAAVWKSKSGKSLNSTRVDADMLEALAEVKEGGKLTVKFLDEKFRKYDTSPHAYIEYITPEDVEAFRSKSQAKDVADSDDI